MPQKTALVTTVRGAGSSLVAFVHYHLYIGFDRLYLFYDDPQEAIPEAVSSHPQVLVTRNDELLQAKWESTRFYRQQRYKGQTLYLMDRQQLNTAVAIEYALQEKIDWILHIDQDELLYAPEFFQSPCQTVGELFQSLADRQIQHVNFQNDELFVHPHSFTDPFHQATLFKRNLSTFPQKRFSPQQLELIAAIPQLPKNFFFNYGNGKSAAKVTEGLLPDGVHDFHLPEQQGQLAHWQRRLAYNRLTKRAAGHFRLVRQFSQFLIKNQQKHHILSKNPVILHYYNSNFTEFWRKYHDFQYVSQFKDSNILHRMSDFHGEAYQAVQTDNVQVAETFYKDRVVVTDPEVVDSLIEAGLVCRITEPALWFKQNVPQDSMLADV